MTAIRAQLLEMMKAVASALGEDPLAPGLRWRMHDRAIHH